MSTITALPEPQNLAGTDTRLSIEDLILLLWSRKALFLTVAALIAALIISWAYLATPIYQAQVKIMPRADDQLSGGGLQSLLGQFGGLGALAGINLGGSINEQEDISLLGSRALFETFARQEKLLPVLFSKAWDPATQRWRPNLKHVPTMGDAWIQFDHGIRRIDQDTKTQIVTLGIRWKDRHQAAAWANELVHLVNEEVRQRAINEADVSIASLQQQLGHTDAVELRDSIYRLMEVQINREVIAKSRPDYAFAVIDPAAVPDANKFASPRRRLLVLVALPFGLAMGALAVVGLQMTLTFMRRLRRLVAGSG